MKGKIPGKGNFGSGTDTVMKLMCNCVD